MKEYTITYHVDGLFLVTVNAENMTDAIKHSNYIFSVADFGEIHDADGIITCVADDDANIEYYDDEIDEVLRRESDEGKIHSI